MGIFDDLFASNQNGGMSLSSVPNPSTAEIIFKLAQTLGPMAPYIGGRNSPMGRVIGAGSVLAGGIGGVGADILQQQRTDPAMLQQRLAQQLIQQGTKAPEGGGPPVFDMKNWTPDQAVVAAKVSPLFDPVKQQELANATKREALIERQINAPLAVGENTTLVDPNDPTRVIRPPSLSEAVRDKQAHDTLYRSFIEDVRTTMKEKGMSRQAAANAVLDKPDTDYAQIPASANYPLVTEAKESRTLANTENAADRRARDAQDREDRRNREKIAAEDRASARADSRFQQQLDTTVLPGVFANKETGEIGQITRGEHAKDAAKFRRVSTQEQQTADLLTNAFPVIDRLEELVPKVLAKYKGKGDLATVIKNYTTNLAAHKVGVDPDVQDLMQLGTALSVEQARALSGSSRVLGSMFNAIRGEVVPGLTVTGPVAMRMLSTGRQELQNRMNSIVGKPLEKIKANDSGPPIAPGIANPYTKMSDDELKKLLMSK